VIEGDGFYTVDPLYLLLAARWKISGNTIHHLPPNYRSVHWISLYWATKSHRISYNDTLMIWKKKKNNTKRLGINIKITNMVLFLHVKSLKLNACFSLKIARSDIFNLTHVSFWILYLASAHRMHFMVISCSSTVRDISD